MSSSPADEAPPSASGEPDADTDGPVAGNGARHDLLSLGEVEAALSSPRPPASGGGGVGSNDGGLGVRLPLLLRWLSVAQPLATVPPPQPPSTLDEGEDEKRDALTASGAPPDPNAIVPLLEDVAASHPGAEDVELLVSSVAPSVCTDVMHKLPAVTRVRRPGMVGGAWDTTWDVRGLDGALRRLANPSDRKRRRSTGGNLDDDNEAKRRKVDEDPMVEKMKMVIDLLEQDGNHKDDKMDEDHPTLEKKESPIFGKNAPVANDEAHELRRVLHDLIVLVKSSLRTVDGSGGAPGDGRTGQGGEDGGATSKGGSFLGETGFYTPALPLKPDSPLAGSDGGRHSLGGGPSVLVPVLMQNVPLLRHEHVANALCRAASPQAPAIVAAMAANACPGASPCLLRGCIAAYQLAALFESLTPSRAEANRNDGTTDEAASEAGTIMRISVESTRRLASLSRREALHAVRTLKEARAMEGLVLSLSMEHDPVGAAAFLVQGLSSGAWAAHGSGQKGTRPSSQKRIVSLRQRMVRSKISFGMDRTSNEGASVHAATAPSRLGEELVRDKSLSEDARRFVSLRMIHLLQIKRGAGCTGLGETSLFIRAHALLVHSIGIGAGSSAGSGSKFVEDSMNAIRQLSVGEDPGREPPAQSPNDEVYKTAVCAAFVTCAKYPPISDSGGSIVGGQVAKACLDCLQGLLLHPPSIESAKFSSRVAGFIVDADAESLHKATVEAIHCNDRREEEDLAQLVNVCSWLSKSMDEGKLTSIHRKGLTLDSLVHDPIVLVEAMRRSTSPRANELDDTLKRMLANPAACAKIIQRPLASSLLKESAEMLARRPAPHIPAVLPLSLDHLAQSLPWDKVSGPDPDARSALAQFLLQLVYALEFLDHQPQSPFVINPRSFPLRESLAYLGSHGGKNSDIIALRMALEKLISKHCPDILFAAENQSNHSGDLNELVSSQSHVIKPTLVCEAVSDCLSGRGDHSGLRAERVFFLCRSTYPSIEVDVAAVGAVLASKRSQPKFYSYAALCKDPLILLKARKSAWGIRGLRSILLRILRDLMRANECIAVQHSPTDAAALDYLTARDIVIVRCIVLACASGFAFGNGPHAKHCTMSVSIIRSIVSKRRGVIATLLKQDLPSVCIDWIVEFIPEALSDAPIITTLLSEPALSTATERLATASNGLRIAIANSDRGMAMAKKLISASTAVLLDSFQLVIGPIGVPVSCLREEDGQDVTSICREEMFLMIQALSGIDPTNKELKNEACVALSKLASLCKSENAAGRRKNLLKEIWDACVQSNTILGGAMQM